MTHRSWSTTAWLLGCVGLGVFTACEGALRADLGAGLAGLTVAGGGLLLMWMTA